MPRNLILSLSLFIAASAWGTPKVSGPAKIKMETATFAGGGFWGMEEVFRKVSGVTGTTVGYTGGTVENPAYEQVNKGTTGHAESIQIQFNSNKVTYETLLKLFFRMHDPTSLNRQGNDVGTQYRSEIFIHSPQQKKTAESVMALVNGSHKWPKPVVTKISTVGKFYPAEEYHQKYLLKNPNGYNDHYVRGFNF